jgi:hypothetical protein
VGTMLMAPGPQDGPRPTWLDERLAAGDNLAGCHAGAAHQRTTMETLSGSNPGSCYRYLVWAASPFVVMLLVRPVTLS